MSRRGSASGSYPNTLGFSPVVRVESAWQTRKGFEHFVSMVQDTVNKTLRAEGALPDVEPSDELRKIYRDAIALLTPMHNDSKLYDPPQPIRDAVEYASLMLINRVRMHRRMALMTMQCATGKTLQPRGCNGVDRGELYHKDTANFKGAYAKYLSNQNALRKRFE